MPQSECCHVHPEQDGPAIASDATINDRLFALIIGINEYKNANTRNLKGCVPDSENFCRFLTESLHANPLHIKHLRNTEATREGILSAFETHLIGNQKIQQDDAIIFYFAGHGSEEFIGESWLTGNKMESICPHDIGTEVRGIPDRTFDCLMRQLASLKGDNITAIFDSCHSGGMGRDSDIENARYLPPPNSPFPQGLDSDIWDKEISNSRAHPTSHVQDPYVPYPSLKSHVLLAACQHDELAYEGSTTVGNRYTGAFTSILLDVLRHPECILAETTYIGLFHTLESPGNKTRLSKQTPYVEGDNKTKILFSTKDTGRYFPVSLSADGKVSAAVGTIHGVDKETLFVIISGNDRFQGLYPSKVMSLSCQFESLHHKTLKDDARAEVTKWNQPHLKVFIHPSRNCRSVSDPNYLAADVAILSLDGSRLELERRDGLLPRYTERFISVVPRDATGASESAIPNTLGHTSAIIIAMTHFNFHLLRQNRSNTVGDKLTVKLERLGDGQRGESGEFTYGPAKGSTITGSAKITDRQNFYCMTLSIRDFSTPLFPYVFAFDALTYEIACFYHPELVKVGPLRTNQVVSIGYGNQGGDPFQFQPNEVTFFKVFVTSKYVDMRSLVQDSPFSEDAALNATGRLPKRFSGIFDGFWESNWIQFYEWLSPR
ncbi:hypothetical protein GALMADRAFT_794930 [Galerina marginata CBS 339.88]|uniref:Peptidase C14 caspase domain-containing protein n=1 Tax=Galerina marginata (strain CBS 339.88) TaxID=685588 RepID=A0A067SVB4_GALM3|nr:hypothetical protein GALMADRAFT_794930 [Galerina marginata CBS 339.88]